MSEPRLRLAVLGCGQAAVLAARALRDLRGVSCAYASREPERAVRFAQKLGGRAFGSYEEALASADVDAVLVATPPATHFELALRALELRQERGAREAADAPHRRARRAGHGRPAGRAPRDGGRELLLQAARARAAGAHRRRRGGRAAVRARERAQDPARGGLAQRPRSGRGRRSLRGRDPLGGLPREPRTPGRARRGVPDRRERERLRRSERAGRVPLLDRRRRHALVLLGDRVGAARAAAVARVRPRGVDRLRVERPVPGDVGARTRRLAFPGLRDISGRRAMWADFVPALQENREPQYDLRHARRDLELVEAVYASARGGGRRAA